MEHVNFFVNDNMQSGFVMHHLILTHSIYQHLMFPLMGSSKKPICTTEKFTHG